MAPRTEFSSEQIRAKARKDLLYLLEGVSKAHDATPIVLPARPRQLNDGAHRYAARRISSLIALWSAPSGPLSRSRLSRNMASTSSSSSKTTTSTRASTTSSSSQEENAAGTPRP